MKKIICTALVLATALWAKSNETFCHTNTNPNSNPKGSCQQVGYVCNLGFNVVGEDNMMYFNLGEDAACSVLLSSNQFPTKFSENDNSFVNFSNFTLIENRESMGPLSLTLASSLAMLAVNNGTPVEIIYKQVGNLYFDGIKILSIKLVNTNLSANP